MVRSGGACRGAEGAGIGCSDALLWPRGLGELGAAREQGTRSRRRRVEGAASFSSQAVEKEGPGRQAVGHRREENGGVPRGEERGEGFAKRPLAHSFFITNQSFFISFHTGSF